MWILRIAAFGFITLHLLGKWGDLPHADTKALQGTWEIVSVERGGEPDASPAGYHLSFTGTKLHFLLPSGRYLRPAPVAVRDDEKQRQMALG